VYNAHPTQTECYYLSILLQHVRGPMSFEDLRTVNCIILRTYQGDQYWKNTRSDAVISEPATKLRGLFIIILIFCQINPFELWSKFRNDLCEGI